MTIEQAILNPYRDEFSNSELKRKSIGWGSGFFWTPNIDVLTWRKALCMKYAWAIPDEHFVEQVKRFTSSPLIEVGAGTGYWAYYLAQFNVQVWATDIKPYENEYSDDIWFDVDEMDAVSAIEKAEGYTLFMVWPEYNSPMAYDALKAYKGDKFIYVGEDDDGCTGNSQFFELLDEEWDMVESRSPEFEYGGVHTRYRFYERLKEPRLIDPDDDDSTWFDDDEDFDDE